MDAHCPRCGALAEIAAPEVARCGDGCGWTARVSTRLRRGNRGQWFAAGANRWRKAEIRCHW